MPFNNYSKMRKLENSIFILIILLVFKIIFPISESLIPNLLSGILILAQMLKTKKR